MEIVRQSKHHLHSLAVSGFALITVSGTSLAADDARIWASNCFQCHGTNGNHVGDIDEIGGESAKSTYEALIEMKYRGRTKNIMDMHSRGYSDYQLREIARYLESLGGQNEDDD